MIRPASYSITIIRRSTFRFVAQIYASQGGPAVNLTGNEVLAQLWNRARTEMYASLTVDTLDAAVGLLRFSLTADQTISLPKVGVYDVKVIYPNGDEFFFLTGGFTLQEGYTDD
jgi:hypothetical protein